MRDARRAALVALLGCSVPLAGCGQPERETTVEAAPPESAGAIDGLSREQIRQQVEAMSPAQAESLGIVDTTIRIESPVPAESARAGGPPLPDAARDTAE